MEASWPGAICSGREDAIGKIPRVALGGCLTSSVVEPPPQRPHLPQWPQWSPTPIPVHITY
jgi:hypothetical protein